MKTNFLVIFVISLFISQILSSNMCDYEEDYQKVKEQIKLCEQKNEIFTIDLMNIKSNMVLKELLIFFI